uniref:AAA family ATPase n=1 Tax=Gemmiger formicilis TaxID=745368 RepID=UPI004028D84D
MNTQIIAIANQKGGVGKTTTCANLGIGLAQAGKKVLLIDGDPQGSLTISLGNPQPDKLPFTLSDAMGRILMDEPIKPGEGILHHPEGVDLMPADIQLSGMEVSLVNAMSRETILRQYLDTLKGQYSHILIDCQPSLGMMETADSVRQYGVLVPAIARPDPEGGYELVAGHRRHRASELAEKETMPVIVRDLDDDAATIIMVDSNLQRESLLPSERAFAYKMKLEAVKHQGARTDLTSAQVGPKLTAAEKIAENSPDSKSQIKRYIRLTELIPELLDMVDERKIALNPAYELSFLKKEEQRDLLDAMDSEQATPSLSQAQRLKKYSQEGHLTLDMMRVIMGEEKKSDLDRVTFTSDTLRKYFPKSYTPQRMQETIIKLLEAWQKKRQRDQER